MRPQGILEQTKCIQIKYLYLLIVDKISFLFEMSNIIFSDATK